MQSNRRLTTVRCSFAMINLVVSQLTIIVLGICDRQYFFINTCIIYASLHHNIYLFLRTYFLRRLSLSIIDIIDICCATQTNSVTICRRNNNSNNEMDSRRLCIYGILSRYASSDDFLMCAHLCIHIHEKIIFA